MRSLPPIRAHVSSATLASFGALLLLAGCGDDDGTGPMPTADAAVSTWTCPPGWAAYGRGGCGPAAIVCGADAGAPQAACDGVDPTMARTETDGDGVVGTHLYRDPSGALTGAWPGGASGLPLDNALDEHWMPTAGIPTCPTGWTRAADGTCDPMLRTDCPDGTGALPAGSCTTTGEADCPSTEWADVSAESGSDTVLRVRADADPATADGTAAHPFATIVAAVTAGGPGAWTLVAAGEYPEQVTVSAPAHIVGTCAAHVTVRGSGAVTTFDAVGTGTALDLRGVRVRGAVPGLRARDGANATLRSIRFEGVAERAIQATGTDSSVDAADVLVVDTVSDPGGDRGQALQCDAGGRIVATRTHLARNRYYGGVVIETGSSLEISDSVVRGTRGTVSGLGRGLSVGMRGMLTVARVVVEDNQEFGIEAETDAHATVQDSIVRGTVEATTPAPSSGIAAINGGTLAATRVLLEGNVDSGASAVQSRSTLTLEDSVVRENVPGSDGRSGLGLVSAAGATLRATRVRVERNTDRGVYTVGSGSSATLVDVVVLDTMVRRSDGASGHGIAAADQAALMATRVLVQGAHVVGILLREMGTSATLEDVAVRQTAPGAGGALGRGISVQGPVTLTARKIGLFRNREAGLLAAGGATVTLEDAVVYQFANDDASGPASAVHAQTGATVDVRRAVLGGPDASGVAARDSDTVVTLRDCVVGLPGDRAILGAGRGVDASAGATVTVRRCLFTRLPEAAVSASGAATMVSVTDSIVSNATMSDLPVGPGLVAFGPATIMATRVALDGVAGLGLGAGNGVDPDGMPTTGATLMATDVFVRDVRLAKIARSSDVPPAPTGADVGYGAFTGPACSLAATHLVLDRGAIGAYASGGVLTVDGGAIARQSDAAGATGASSPMLSLVGVSVIETPETGVVPRMGLPEPAPGVAVPTLCSIESSCL